MSAGLGLRDARVRLTTRPPKRGLFNFFGRCFPFVLAQKGTQEQGFLHFPFWRLQKVEIFLMDTNSQFINF